MSYNDWTLSYKKILKAFPTLSGSTTRHLPYVIGILGFLGFLDATYLTILHYKNTIPPCTLHGCEVVLSSVFATIGGVPIALIGAGYYLVVLGLVGIVLTCKSESRVTNYELRKKENRNSLFIILNSKNISTLLTLLTG